ncbi:11628_t:CDS:1 [Acaulospora colombiana]|uniref:11628_t:CDS:1 n=1 Tax=Acaulospora colombiana TaxID=27376 RepID=A0ACA9ME15_9GLOM|nr:11628_t:CDS:1 [Acaulospora colombiana]
MSNYNYPGSSGIVVGKGKGPKNPPPPIKYQKSHKNITFIFAPESNLYKISLIGGEDNILEGIVHLSYEKPTQIKSISLNLKCTEKTTSYESQGRANTLFSGVHILIDKTEKIWESKDEKTIETLDIPFRILLPDDLPEMINTKFGQVSYVLKAIVHQKSFFVSSTQTVEIMYPLKKLIHDNTNASYYKLRGESKNGMEYSFDLPPNKIFNIGTWVPIPMRIRFLTPDISIDRIEISLKTSMDFRFDKPRNTTRQISEKAISMVIPRQDIFYLQPTSSHYHGECVATIDLTVPQSLQPSYNGRVISITHHFYVRFYLWDSEKDFTIEEDVTVAHIHEPTSQTPRVGTPNSSQYQIHLMNYSPSYITPQSSGNYVEDPDEIRVATPIGQSSTDNDSLYIYEDPIP